MHWLALQWPPEAGDVASARAPATDGVPPHDALAWWALGFTPHVVWLDEALLLEVSACERLWGGRRALIQRVLQSNPAQVGVECARAATSLVALARLRCQPMRGAWALAAMAEKAQQPARPTRPADLPLHTLTAARPHLPVLARLGCRSWGDVVALPRAGLARRFGPELGRALDIAFGHAPDVHAWITPPDRFEQSLELPERADSAPALLWSARRLLTALQHWLAARQRGVLALELAWTFDQRRLDGKALPPKDAIVLRTAEGVQGMAHIQRLLAERLVRTPLLAPARAIRLRVLETASWNPITASFLPEDQPRGDPLHVFVERASARLGSDRVRVLVPHADHRPECRQRWQSAEQGLSKGQGARDASVTPVTRTVPTTGLPDALSPTWLLREPQPLTVDAGQPCHQGQRLRLIAGPHRLETGWWSAALPDVADGAAAARDYFIAQNPAAELLWVYRERPTTSSSPSPRVPSPGGGRLVHKKPAPERWFLQGLYA